MQETTGDLFGMECSAICIPTNGAVDRYGRAVMGAGLAKQAAARWAHFPTKLGEGIKREGNIVHILTARTPGKKDGPYVSYGKRPVYHVLSFPTKPARFYPDVEGWDRVLPAYRAAQQEKWPKRTRQYIPGWMGYSNLSVIKHSAEELVEITDDWGWQSVCLPLLGCGMGGLAWLEVKDLLNPILDDRFTIVHYKEGPNLEERIQALFTPSQSDEPRGDEI